MNESLDNDEPMFPESEIVFAKFWVRFGAMLIDGLITIIIVLPVTYFNVIQWKIPWVYILTSLITIIYKPFMEYQFGATLGKMAVGIKVVGHQFEKVTLQEELRRVSFYIVPNIIQQVLTLNFYFSHQIDSIQNYKDYNNFIVSSNPALYILNIIVVVLFIIDCITFFSNMQNRSLHDLYAGTYVIEKPSEYEFRQ
ncbi:MAG TPA: RDD family protein [Puia sp.]|jgi:uncharacterized RDD family membrane protein YckC